MEAKAFIGSKINPTMVRRCSSRPNVSPTASWRPKVSPSSRHLWLRNTTFPTKHANNLKLSASSWDLESTRPLIEFPPSLWGDRFLSVPATDKSELEALKGEIDELKPKVREMLMSCRSNDKERIHLIHLLISLGVSYHFESEIEETLKHAFGNLGEVIDDEFDLYTISVMFQTFRVYGHKMPCDVFCRFKGEDGKFMKCLERDPRAMLSLYEASYLGTSTEDIMDEAMSFTLNYLQSLETDEVNPHLHSLIKNALHLPRYRNMEILVIKEYISFYEQEEDHNDILLEFAKRHFKYLQLHYIQELKTISKWWKGLDLPSKLPYIRDRIVECYFASTGAYFEPQYSLGRIMLTKLLIISDTLDVTCDAYGTLPEVENLADFVERWDLGVIHKLPNYMKTLFSYLLQVLAEIEPEVRREGKSYTMQYAKEEVKIFVRALQSISKWAREGHVPTFEEYMEVAVVTTGASLMAEFVVVWMGEVADNRILEWVRSRPKMIQVLYTMARLINDKVTYKHEMSRGEIANGINCYMKQFGVTEEEAVKEFQRMYDNNYKILMEEFFNTTDVPLQALVRILKGVRVIDVIYKDGDGYTYPQGKIDKHINSLFNDRIQL